MSEKKPSKGAIWNEFSKQHQHLCIKSTISNDQLALLGATLMFYFTFKFVIMSKNICTVAAFLS